MWNFSSVATLAILFCTINMLGCDLLTLESSADSKPIWYEPERESTEPILSSNKSDSTSTAVESLFDSETSTELASLLKEPKQREKKKVQKKEESKYGICASLNGFRPFPDNDSWNQDISKKEVDPNSDRILAHIGLGGHLHPDFGSGTWDGGIIGIPYIVVPGDQPRVTIEYQAYGDESDPGPFPFPFNTPVEGQPLTDGDRHAIVVDRDNWMLYELYRAFPKNGGAKWIADSGAVFNLKTNTKRPVGWTSADAAGLPVFPGLVRYDEVAERKEIRHAVRFTLARTRRAYVAPASHWASSDDNELLPPLGMRVRLKADVDISKYPEQVQVILRALKKYGMILADNGSDWFISGTADERWDNEVLSTLKKIKVRQLEIIKMEKIVTPYSL